MHEMQVWQENFHQMRIAWSRIGSQLGKPFLRGFIQEKKFSFQEP
jgi:hypothetical protein